MILYDGLGSCRLGLLRAGPSADAGPDEMLQENALKTFDKDSEHVACLSCNALHIRNNQSRVMSSSLPTSALGICVGVSKWMCSRLQR